MISLNKAGKVLVTGGAGFIGSHLVEKLIQCGAKEVRVIDCLEYGSITNLQGFEDKITLSKLDLRTASVQQLSSICSGVDWIFHLAAEKHNATARNPHRMLEANIQGTLNLLEAAISSGVSRILFTSSLYAYGRTTGGPFVEGEELRPATIYGISKVAGEHLCDMYSRRNGIETVIIRPLFVYGPRQYSNSGYKSVIVKNFQNIMKGRSPVVCGDGEQTLDYIYVTDAVKAILQAMSQSSTRSVFNVGSGVGVSILSLTQHMMNIAGYTGPIEFAAADWTAGSSRIGSIERIAEALNWQPSVDLDCGLRQTYQWLQGCGEYA